MQICPRCGEENPPRFRLCGFCGAQLAPELPDEQERRIVTIFFSDLKDSTRLGESLDPESLREVMSRYFDAMTAVLRRHGGTIEKFIGDAIMAVFGLPSAHEDDALRAVRAAVETRVTLAALNAELQSRYGVVLTNRTGVNTGEVVAGDPTAGQRLVTGDAVNTAARLEQAAPANDVLIGDLTYRLVRDDIEVEPVEPLELKGKAERVPAYRVVALRTRAALDVRHSAPLVGREDQRQALRVAFGRAAAERRCRMVTVIGEAGVGKSRLVAELLVDLAAEARSVRGRCLPYGEGITFWPLFEIVRTAAAIETDDTPTTSLAKVHALIGDPGISERVAAAIGISDDTFPLQELLAGARDFLRILARERPIVVVVDDIHWAEAAFLDLLEHMVATVEDAPILLVTTARRELLERRDGWAATELSTSIHLERLSDAETTRMTEHLLGDAGVPAAVQTRVVAAADGNPLFLEHLVSMLIDDGVLRSENGAWRLTRPVAEIPVPPSISALLSARIDRLVREERMVVESASVIGVEFAPAAVTELVPDPLRDTVPTHLAAVTAKDFVRPHPSSVVGEDALRFQHVLVRDAAYQRLLKRARATLHERFVAWADKVNREREGSGEFDELLGYHLEQAYHYLAELGPLDEHGHDVGRRAAERLAWAGRRAFARGDMTAASNLLRRAAATLTSADPARPAIILDLGEALMELGDFADATRWLGEALELARKAGQDLLATKVGLIRLLVERYAGDTKGWSARARSAAEQALELFSASGDEAGLTTAWRLLTWVHGPAGNYDEAAAAGSHVMEHARRQGDRRQEARGAIAYAMALFYGTTPIDRAIEGSEKALEQVEGDRRTQALVMTRLAELYARRGEIERGRDTYGTARTMLAELGSHLHAASVALQGWRVEMLAGDVAAAERELRDAHAVLESLGDRYYLSTVAAALAVILVEAGRLDEADAFADEAARLADDDDVQSQTLWRRARACSDAARGRVDEAVRNAQEAVRLSGSTQDVLMHAEALRDLANVLRTAGDEEAAFVARRAALEQFLAKGDLVSVAQLESQPEPDVAPAP